MIPRRFLSLILFLGLILQGKAACADFDVSSVKGPHIKDLYMVIYRDPDSQMLALQKGELDVLGDIARPSDVDRLASNQEISLSISRGFHLFFMGFNLRKEPWNDRTLRHAAAMAVPSRQIVRDIFSGYSEPVDTYLPPVSPYYEPDVTVHEHDPAKARQILADAGWKWSTEGTLIPPGGDRPLKAVKLLSPTAQVAPTTAEISNRIAEALKSIGIPLSVEPLDFSSMISRLDRHDFDLFVMAWSLSRDPDSLFAFFHSSMDVPGGYNIQGLHDPELDKVLEELRWAPDEKTADGAARKAQRMLSDISPWIPIYSRYMVAAVRDDWEGVVSTRSTSADNLWTLLNMRPLHGGERPVMWCLPEEPRSLNPLGTSSAYDWQVLALIYEGLIAVDPETLGDLPWLATDWKVETVDGEGGPHTRLTFTLREGVRWQDGIPFTSRDVRKTLEFLKEHEIPRYYDNVRDIERIDTPDDHTVIVTMGNVSYWHLHNIGGSPVFPAHILETVKDWESWQPARETNPSVKELTSLVGTGPFVFREYRPGEFVHLVRNEGFWLLGGD
ncbi:MAG: Oligopeptide-binding protein AppA precursor [Synergistetes bacterium ADurb.Bin155]|jgi:peptide/nickel transport system substrate-binding protein|nr:ABC transporter substrate-binding protein [Synergistales bacterium]NMD17655.1 ABC transporter substrate-binding protein [Synergistaceae bacterium]OQB45813.1 MAG: Oligopeptide-binding protein AppA precursor [Synergistetes bacterium ADurb.Bin155]